MDRVDLIIKSIHHVNTVLPAAFDKYCNVAWGMIKLPTVNKSGPLQKFWDWKLVFYEETTEEQEGQGGSRETSCPKN